MGVNTPNDIPYNPMLPNIWYWGASVKNIRKNEKMAMEIIWNRDLRFEQNEIKEHMRQYAD